MPLLLLQQLDNAVASRYNTGTGVALDHTTTSNNNRRTTVVVAAAAAAVNGRQHK